MKMLIFRSANFKWNQNSQISDSGLVCLCHVEKDDVIKVNTISGIIQSENKDGRNVIIVPFPFLDESENKMPNKPAKQLLEKLREKIPNCILATGYKHNIFELSMSIAKFGIPDNRLLFQSV